MSPCLASSIAFLVNVSASPSRSTSAAIVARLRVPGRLPAGLPLVPFGNGRPRWRCFSAAFAAGILSVQFSSAQLSSVQFSSVQFSSVQFSSVQFSVRPRIANRT
jgi:hypothetical protein